MVWLVMMRLVTLWWRSVVLVSVFMELVPMMTARLLLSELSTDVVWLSATDTIDAPVWLMLVLEWIRLPTCSAVCVRLCSMLPTVFILVLSAYVDCSWLRICDFLIIIESSLDVIEKMCLMAVLVKWM